MDCGFEIFEEEEVEEIRDARDIFNQHELFVWMWRVEKSKTDFLDEFLISIHWRLFPSWKFAENCLHHKLFNP
jgi:hypothetical protein